MMSSSVVKGLIVHKRNYLTTSKFGYGNAGVTTVSERFDTGAQFIRWYVF